VKERKKEREKGKDIITGNIMAHVP